MPKDGKATYKGYASYWTEESGDEPELMSQIKLNANFKDSEISGRLYNLRDAENARLDGEIKVANGGISGNGFGADLKGNLTHEGVEYSIDGTLDGALHGPNADYAKGGIDATATSGKETTKLVGKFIAAR